MTSRTLPSDLPRCASTVGSESTLGSPTCVPLLPDMCGATYRLAADVASPRPVPVVPLLSGRRQWSSMRCASQEALTNSRVPVGSRCSGL